MDPEIRVVIKSYLTDKVLNPHDFMKWWYLCGSVIVAFLENTTNHDTYQDYYVHITYDVLYPLIDEFLIKRNKTWSELKERPGSKLLYRIIKLVMNRKGDRNTSNDYFGVLLTKIITEPMDDIDLQISNAISTTLGFPATHVDIDPYSLPVSIEYSITKDQLVKDFRELKNYDILKISLRGDGKSCPYYYVISAFVPYHSKREWILGLRNQGTYKDIQNDNVLGKEFGIDQVVKYLRSMYIVQN